MREEMQVLYEQLRDMSAMYLVYQDRKIVSGVREYLPQIQKFSLWFLEKNEFGIEEELYQGLSSNLLNILQDIVGAIEQEDMVLLNDALAYGFMDYLGMFIDTEQEEKSDDAV